MMNLVASVIVFAHWFNIHAVKCSLNDFNAGQTTTVEGDNFLASSTQGLFEENTRTEATTTELVSDGGSAIVTSAELTWSSDSQSNETSFTTDPEWTNANLYDTYCRPDLCLRYDRFGELVSKKHVACGFNGSFSDTCPPGRMILKTDSELRQLILDLHNQVRDRLASGAEKGAEFAPASRMPTVVWDDELANLAEINVRGCKFEHDECRSTEKFLHAGQNLATGSYYLETDILAIVRNLTMLWYHEFEDTTQHVLETYTTEFNATIGHYTQMISDRTTAIGCGIVIYPNKMEDFVFKTVLYACNYAITSIVGQPVYLQGQSASRCRSGSNPAFSSLCNVEENELIKAIPFYD